MQYVGGSECDMEKGQLRCDANVSVRLKGAEKFGTKAEVKNLNSFRFAKMALDYEIARQVALLESGGKVSQETRLYNVATGETVVAGRTLRFLESVPAARRAAVSVE